MNANKFIEYWVNDLNMMISELPAFAKNMDHISKKDESFLDRTYVDWIGTWLAWAELSSEDDIRNSFDPFGNVDEE